MAGRTSNAGIKTVWDLRNAPENWIKKEMSVVGLSTVKKLKGYTILLKKRQNQNLFLHILQLLGVKF